MLLYCSQYGHIRSEQFLKLRRSDINNFTIPELDGLSAFVNKVFVSIVFTESQPEVTKLTTGNEPSNVLQIPFDDSLNLEQLFFQNIKDGRYITRALPVDISHDPNNGFAPKGLRLSYLNIEQPGEQAQERGHRRRLHPSKPLLPAIPPHVVRHHQPDRQ